MFFYNYGATIVVKVPAALVTVAVGEDVEAEGVLTVAVGVVTVADGVVTVAVGVWHIGEIQLFIDPSGLNLVKKASPLTP